MVEEQSAARPAQGRTYSHLTSATAREQRKLASELAEEARRLTARARELLAQGRAERAAMTGIGIAMLRVARSTATVVQLRAVAEPTQPPTAVRPSPRRCARRDTALPRAASR
jgi:hypothetical protein